VPRQAIVSAADARPELEVVAAREGEVAGLMGAAIARGFDLARELPLRAHLYALTDGEGCAGGERHVLLVLLHHIAGDGASLGPLTRDLSEFYRARVAGEAARLPALSVQYADYTLWQRAGLGEEGDADREIAGQLLYWTDRLAGLPEQIELPFDRARPSVSSHRGGSVALEVGADLHGGLERLARSEGSSLFMAVQAGLVGLLSRLGAGDDIALGSPIAGR